MKIKYDSDADAMYIQLREGKRATTKQIDKYTIIDFDAVKQVIGIELLFVKERNPEFLEDIEVENLTMSA